MVFLWQHMGLRKFEDRIIKNVHVPEDYFLSGDLLLMSRFDGIEPVDMVASGSHAGHAAMTIWKGDELFVIECVDGWQLSIDKDGVQVHEY